MEYISTMLWGATMDKFEKGTILYELQPYCDALLPVMRDEKDKKGKPYQHISDTTGIPMDNLKRFYTGEHKQPCVYKIAALCKYFGLSMDALFGLSPAAQAVANAELEQKNATIEALQAELHALSAQQADYQGRIADLKNLILEMNSDKAEYKAAMKRKNRIIRVLSIALGIFVLLALALLIADLLTNHTGWFRV